MRKTLKLGKKCNDASYPSKDQPRTAEMLTDSSFFNDEADFASSVAKGTHDSDVVAAAICARKVKPHPEHRRTVRAKDITIAPISLHTTQHNGSQQSSKGKLDHPLEKLQKSKLPSQSENVQQVKSQQRSSTVSYQNFLTERKGNWRKQLSPSARHGCLEEILMSNPAFPVRAVFNILQKKTSLQDSEYSLNLSSSENHLKEKRKESNESCESVPIRLRSGLITECAAGIVHRHMSAEDDQESTVLMARKRPRSYKLSRTRRLKQQSGSSADLVNNCEPFSELMNGKEYCSQSLHTSDLLQKDLSFEDVLWTDKYSPQHSSEVIGNSSSVNKLQSWLKKWKLRAVCDERRTMEEIKQEESSNDSWDCGDFQGEAGAEDAREEPLCNAMLITGPPGVGKTASVYACSQELGFQVFEVNCSSQRSGCHVLSQLKEATQSHLVEMSGKDPLKPIYFNNYSSSAKSDTFPGKKVHPKNVTSKRRAAQNFGRFSRQGKPSPATVTLANYFKMKAKADHLYFDGLLPSEKPDCKPSSCISSGSDQTVPQNEKTATSLILFEEVDVIFDDDVGFLAAIKTFMTTTKRPIVLTTNDPSFRERFNCSLEEIVFKVPSAANVCSYLQLVALAENVWLELGDIRSLLRQCGGDIRRCLLQLQLWARSGGGRVSQSGGLPEKLTCEQSSSVTERGDAVDSQLPHCDTGCTASMLGLHCFTKNQLLNLFKCLLWSEIDMIKLLRLLAESWRGGVPLLYTNLEFLLLIRARGTSVHLLDKGTCGLQSELSPPDLHIQQLGGNLRPKASAADNKSVRNISRLSRRKYITTFNITSSSSVTQTPQRTSSSNRANSRATSSRDKTEQNTARVSTNYMDALTDFFDLMSYLDATMPAPAPLVSGSCRPGGFVWTGAEIKDGLLDEVSEEEEEEGRSRNRERLLDIQAAVEGLGCHRCLRRVSDAWTEVQRYRQGLGDERWGRLVESLTLPISSKSQCLSFSFQPLCAPSVSQKRYKLSRTVLGRNPFSLLGNRSAVCVDYMPVLRHIGRCQRAQRQKEEPARCLNYLSGKHLGLSKSTIRLLAEDFP